MSWVGRVGFIGICALALACRPAPPVTGSPEKMADSVESAGWNHPSVPAHGRRAETVATAMGVADVTCASLSGGARTAAVAGKVTDERGAEVAGAVVEVSGPEPIAATITDGRGTYLIPGLVVPGPYAVSVRPPEGSLAGIASLGYVCVTEPVHVLPDLKLASPSHATPGGAGQGRRVCRTCHGAGGAPAPAVETRNVRFLGHGRRAGVIPDTAPLAPERAHLAE